MSGFKIYLYFALLLFVTTCKTNLHQLATQENKLKINRYFSSYLALEYLEYSRSLSSNSNWWHSEYFAKKGLNVANGRQVIPESPISWRVDPLELEDAITAQKRMEDVSTYEIKKLLPVQLAHLTFLYDCWISKESKPVFRMGEMSRCKVRFYKLLDEIERYIEDMKRDRKPKTIIHEDEFERFEIVFDFDKFNFTDKANKKLIEILKYLAELNGDYRILLVGNADRVGKDLYNDSLALKRVGTVKNYLIKNGVAQDMIGVRSFGENFPDIITKNSVQHQLNRTVGVYILKGIGRFENYPVPLVENYVYKKDVIRARQKRGVQ